MFGNYVYHCIFAMQLKTTTKQYNMKPIQVNLYKFEELSATAQEVAINNNRHICVDYDWWALTYEDAETIGIKIDSFDIDSGQIRLSIQSSEAETANDIKANHGENCDTYKAADTYLTQYAALVSKYSDGINTEKASEGNEDAFDDEANVLDIEFKRSMQNAYLKILKDDYEYLTSDEAIKESLIANEYEFTENGKRY